MTRFLTALLAVAALAGAIRAEDKKDPVADKAKPTGVWVKEADGLKLTFDFRKADAVTVTADIGENNLVIVGKYTVAKDGLIKITATKVDVKGDFPAKPKDGYTFEFKLKAEGKTAKISDFDASEEADGARGVVEGEYTKDEPKQGDK